MTGKSAIEFLFFSYFNDDIARIKEDKSELLGVAIDRAYRDAASHVLRFNSLDFLGDKEKRNIVKTYKVISYLEILKYIMNISERKENLRADWIELMADRLMKIYELLQEELASKVDSNIKNRFNLTELKQYVKKGGEFTFGIAQKWLNMTVKNIYVMDSIIKIYLDKDETCLSNVCNIFDQYVDIPVDDYIIKAACNRLSVKVPSENKEQKKGEYLGNNDKYAEKLAWSKWQIENDDEDLTRSYYRAFQHRMKSALANDKEFVSKGNLLDMENRLWINTAMGLYEKK